MQNYTINEIGNICKRCLTKENKNISNFIIVFEFYQKQNDTKFNECFKVERQWDFIYSTDETKFMGYSISQTIFPEMISVVLEKQYQKISKLIFEEENKNAELQDSINELEC